MSEPGVWLQDDPVEWVEVPPRPDLAEFARRGAAAQEAVDTIGTHSFEAGENLCRDCGIPIDKATTRRCGSS